jgi:hypothetical protein
VERQHVLFSAAVKNPVLFAAACLAAFAADNTLTPAEKQAGFRLLFDGSTMQGWRDPAGEKPPGEAWVVEDGCLKTTAKPRIREDLITRESFGDFELKFDWRISARGNTGVKYRIQRIVFADNTKADRSSGGFEATLERELRERRSDRANMASGATGQEYTVAYEFQLIDDASYPDLNKRDLLHATGALYSMIPPRAMAARAAGEWNQSRLLVKGDHFEHWINGVKVLDGALSSDQSRAGTAKRWAAAPTIRDILLQAKPAGPLSLQHHGAAVWFKNLKIRPR